MNNVQMVDLKSQYNKIQEEVDASVLEVIRSSQYINGPYVKQFQADLEQYLGVKHVIPCGNGTDALQIALMALDLEPGDEVITADFTFAATVEVIKLLQLTPVLVDVNQDTFLIDIESVKKVITPKTKAIIPVHLFGQVANMNEIMELAKARNIFVVEDTAQAIGAEYTLKNGGNQKAGTIGHIGTTSFFPSKNLGCYGDGGAIFTNDDDLAYILRGLVNHGMYKRYHHDKVGVNSRLDSIQAAILKAKLPHLDIYNANRNKAADFYDKAFANNPNIIIPARAENSNHVFHQYTLKIKGVDRNELQKYLSRKNVPAMIYYPIPLHSQVAYTDKRYKEEDFKVTNQLINEVVSLPMHSEMNNEILTYITESVLSFFK